MTDRQPADSAKAVLQKNVIERHKLLSNREEIVKIAGHISELLKEGKTDELRSLLSQYYPPDVADMVTFLDENESKEVFQLLDTFEKAEVLDEVDDPTRARFLQGLTAEQAAFVLSELHSDEGADILGVLPAEKRQPILEYIEKDKADHIRQLLTYPCDTAGGVMSTGFVSVPESGTLADALEIYRSRPDAEPLYDIYAIDQQGNLKGILTLRQLLTGDPSTPVASLMSIDIVSVPPEMDQERVARIFARYDLTALPVVSPWPAGKLLGVITSDDVIDVIQQENTEDFLRMAGSDAEEMEKSSPARIALLRLPWIMATMFIELLAGVVIHFYDATLAKVLLLASFMPIISAISGNTGLQSATIIVRGLSAGQVRITEWRRAITRQLTMTLILGSVAGLVLGAIGAIWYGKVIFGLVVAVGMFAAVNIAGIVGTAVPLTSKRLGFDPAITSGPFETAFQDVVGISIFLSLATLMIRYLMK